MDPLTWSFWQQLGMAVLCGAILGGERELNDKPAGLRTGILVCLGAMVFVRLGVQLQDGNTDPTRVLGQVATGVGFIGAGVILARGRAVKGVTTASVIWLLAAIGAVIGADQLAAALTITVVALILLVGLNHVERHGGSDDEVETDDRQGED